ncbi:ankyrin repeat-containing domain protein [Xylariaceae sp. FL1019]|nr:ankyrin repeat-containing domain protein [Xylariaceae sp. FL1019]
MTVALLREECEQLFAAAESGNTTNVDNLVAVISIREQTSMGHVFAITKDEDGNTIMHKAAGRGAEAIIRYYMTRFTNSSALRHCLPNVKTIMRYSPTHMAARGGQVGFIRRLIERGCNINKSGGFRFTAQHHAATNQDTAFACDLIQIRGIDFCTQSMSAETALHITAHKNDLGPPDLYPTHVFTITSQLETFPTEGGSCTAISGKKGETHNSFFDGLVEGKTGVTVTSRVALASSPVMPLSEVLPSAHRAKAATSWRPGDFRDETG